MLPIIMDNKNLLCYGQLRRISQPNINDMPKTVCYGIMHPTKGLIGRDGYCFPNQEKPNEISLASLLFTTELFTIVHRDEKWGDYEVVPVTI